MSISGLDIKGTPSYDPFIYIKETLQQLIDENMDLSPIRELLIKIYNTDNLKYNNFDIMYNMNDEDLLRYIILRISCINEKDRDLLLSKAREIKKQHYSDPRNLEDYEHLDYLIRLYYFYNCLGFSDDIIYIISAKIEEIIQKPRSEKQRKTLDTEMAKLKAYANNRLDNDRLNNDPDGVKKIFDSKFTENQRSIIRNGPISEKLKEINKYLQTVDDLDVYWELYNSLKFLEEYITMKDPIR